MTKSLNTGTKNKKWYVGQRGLIIFIPFIPPKVIKMRDRFIIIHRIFGNDLSDEFSDIYDTIVLAIDNPTYPDYWEEVGMMLLSLHNNYYDTWANHFFIVANKIRERVPHKKEKKIIPYYSSENIRTKFKRLLSGRTL